MQHNSTRYNTTQRNATQCNATQQRNATQYNVPQRNAIECNAMQRNTTQQNATQHNTYVSHKLSGCKCLNVAHKALSFWNMPVVSLETHFYCLSRAAHLILIDDYTSWRLISRNWSENQIAARCCWWDVAACRSVCTEKALMFWRLIDAGKADGCVYARAHGVLWIYSNKIINFPCHTLWVSAKLKT